MDPFALQLVTLALPVLAAPVLFRWAVRIFRSAAW